MTGPSFTPPSSPNSSSAPRTLSATGLPAMAPLNEESNLLFIWIQNLKQNVPLRNIGLVSLATVIGHICGFVSAIVTRTLLDPSLMGIWSGLRIFLSYGNYAGLGISKGAAREIAIEEGRGNTKHIQHVMNTAFTFNTLTSICYMIVILIMAVLIRSHISSNLSHYWVGGLTSIAIFVVLQRYVTFAITVLRAQQRFDLTARLSVLEAILSLSVIGIGVWLFGFWGLLLSSGCVFIASVLYIHHYTPVRFVFTWDSDMGKRLLKSGFPILLNGALFSILQSLDRLMILVYLTDREYQLGCYSLALMVNGALFGIGNIVGVVMYPRYQHTYGATGNPCNISHMANRVMLYKGCLLLVLTCICVFIVRPLLETWFTAYRLGINPMMALLPGTVLLALTLPMNHFLVTIHRQKMLVGITLTGILIAISANLAVLTREGGITEVAWATSTTYGLFFLLTSWVYHKEVQRAASNTSA